MRYPHCILVLVSILALQMHAYPSFGDYCKSYGKNWEDGTEEYKKRQQIYSQYVEELEKGTCQNCGINVFSDETDEQFQKRLTLSSFPSKYMTAGKRINLKKNVGAPNTINWLEQGAVTSVKNQGRCGTCWSFSTTAMVQSSLILKDQASLDLDLSQQYLLQCTPYSTCDQGFLYYATETAVKDGLPYESQFPYQERVTGRTDICGRKENVKNSPTFTFYNEISQNQIKDLLIGGPLSISVSASSWKNYVGGIHYCGRNDKKNHAVLLVGYDENSWLIKNQWGLGWGESGYMRIGFGSLVNCGIGEQVLMLFQKFLFFPFLILSILVLI